VESFLTSLDTPDRQHQFDEVIRMYHPMVGTLREFLGSLLAAHVVLGEYAPYSIDRARAERSLLNEELTDASKAAKMTPLKRQGIICSGLGSELEVCR
jgi:hypothetical protein